MSFRRPLWKSRNKEPRLVLQLLWWWRKLCGRGAFAVNCVKAFSCISDFTLSVCESFQRSSQNGSWFDFFICLNQGHATKNYWFIFPNSRSRSGRPNPHNPTKFIVNHPFVFFLRDARSGALLFQVRDLFVIFESFPLYISIFLFHFLFLWFFNNPAALYF